MSDTEKIHHHNMYSTPGDITFSARDELNRKNIAENLCRLLKSKNFPSPFLLDGPWGIGKTEFCYKLINLVKDKNNDKTENVIIPIYINVFSAERVNNPFLVMMAAIQGTIQKDIDLEEKNKSWFKKLLEKGAKIANKEISLQALAPAITKDLVQISSGTNIEPILSLFSQSIPTASIRELSKQLKKPAQKDIFVKSLESIYELDKEYQEFQDALTDFATEANPIVFIIDELDRCQPDFAIKFLEKIKYLFDVPNVCFLFSCDSSQLLATINHSYGYNLEAETYLEKFFKSKCYLTINDNLTLDSKLISNLVTSIKKENSTQINDEDITGVSRVLSLMCSIYSIRRLEKTINFIISLGQGKFENLHLAISNGERASHYSNFFLSFYRILTLIDIFLYNPIATSQILQGGLDDEKFNNIIDNSMFKRILNLHSTCIEQKKLRHDLTIPIEDQKFSFTQNQVKAIFRYFNTFGTSNIFYEFKNE